MTTKPLMRCWSGERAGNWLEHDDPASFIRHGVWGKYPPASSVRIGDLAVAWMKGDSIGTLLPVTKIEQKERG